MPTLMNTRAVGAAVCCLLPLAAGICLWAVEVDRTGWVLASKWAPAVLLALYTLHHGTTRPHRLLVAALLACACGDVTLEGAYAAPASTVPWFAIGLGCFLAAHGLFIGLFLQLPRRRRRWPLPAFALYAVPFFVLLLPRLGPMLIPVAIYMLVIGVMVWRAACVLLPNGPAWAVIAGALLFAGSDSLIAINRFLAPFDAARTLILLSYWAALILLTVGTLRALPPRNPIRR